LELLHPRQPNARKKMNFRNIKALAIAGEAVDPQVALDIEKAIIKEVGRSNGCVGTITINELSHILVGSPMNARKEYRNRTGQDLVDSKNTIMGFKRLIDGT
jgi:hypothetical protein